MKKFKLIVGIDFSKDSLDVQWRGIKDSAPTHKTFQNSAIGIKELFDILVPIEPDTKQILFCGEHTGVYIDKFSAAVQSLDSIFWAVHPRIISNYNPHLQRGKNDLIDAGKILEYACNHEHLAKHYKQRDWDISQLRDLFRTKKQLIKMRTKLFNFKHVHSQQAMKCPTSLSINQDMLEQIKKNIRKCDKEIETLIKKSPKLSNAYHILQTIPGIGPVTAIHLIAISECFEKINNYKAFACFIGIAPFEHSSGSSVRKRTRVSHSAYKPLKADLHQGAMSVMREGLLFHDYYEKMKALNKHHLWIINAISNKIAKLAFDLIHSNQFFDQNKYLNNKKSMKINLVMS